VQLLVANQNTSPWLHVVICGRSGGTCLQSWPISGVKQLRHKARHYNQCAVGVKDFFAFKMVQKCTH